MTPSTLRIMLVHDYLKYSNVCTYGACRYLVNLYYHLKSIKGVEAMLVASDAAVRIGKSFKPHIAVYEWAPKPKIEGALTCMILHGDTQLNYDFNRKTIQDNADMILVNSTTLLNKAKGFLESLNIPYKVVYPPFVDVSVGALPKLGNCITLPSNLKRKGGELFVEVARYCKKKDGFPYKFLSIAGTLNEKVDLPEDVGHNWPIQPNFGRVLSYTSIMVHASQFESFGYSWLEAGYRGIPVVGTLSDGMKELGLANWGIVIADKDDMQEWYDAFIKIHSDYSGYSQKAKDYFAESPLTHSLPSVKKLVEWWKNCIDKMKT